MMKLILIRKLTRKTTNMLPPLTDKSYAHVDMIKELIKDTSSDEIKAYLQGLLDTVPVDNDVSHSSGDASHIMNLVAKERGTATIQQKDENDQEPASYWRQTSAWIIL
jgi:hypothetical protein